MSSEQAQQLTTRLLDSKFVLNVDGLLDGIIALWNDCNNPVLKKTHRNIESFLERNENVVKTLLECRISAANFNLIKVIGRGAFGEVQLVRNAQNKKVYAMKLLEKEKMSKRTDAAFFWEERDIMAYADSDWIVRLHYAFQDQRYLYMVMEFMPGGDLVNLMANHDIPEDWVQFYTAELVLALTTIHSMGYIHRDVKPDNMLISASGHIKLADFGTCVKMNPDGLVRCSTAVGTPDYISPEVLRHQGSEGTFGREVDWWAVGVTMYEMLVGETPFYSDSLITTYQRIQEHNKHLKFPDDVKMSSQAKDIVRKFLAEPNVRLGKDSVAGIKAHPFFKNAQWNFDTIKNATPPYIPQLVSDDDASHFDEVEPAQAVNLDNFHQGPKGFSGNELPFIGFTYSNEFGPLEIIRQKINNGNGEGGQKQQNDNKNEQKGPVTNGQNQQQQIHENGANQQQLLTNGLLLNNGTTMQMPPPPPQMAAEKHHQHVPTMEENNIVEHHPHHHQAQHKMVAPPRHSAEVETLKFEKRVIENKMKDLQEQVNAYRKQSEDYQQRLETEQKFIELYKLEIEARERDSAERDKRLQSIPQLEQQIEEFRQKFERERDDAERDKRLQTIPALEQQIEEFRQTLERERAAHRLLESSFLGVQKEKSLLEDEIRQMMHRHEQEYKSYNAQLQNAAQRENDLTNRVHQLENEVQHIRKHSHGPMGLAPVSGTTSGLSSAISTSSLVSNANSLNSGMHNVTLNSTTAGVGGDLEGLTKEQLIQRCQREIQMKQQVIDKLAYLGMQKGINDDLAGRGVNSKKKKKREEKRIREVVEFQMDQQSKKYQQRIAELEGNIQYMHLLLHEEQQKGEEKDELLAMYKQTKGELNEATRNLMPLEPRRVPPRRLRGAV